jgi:alkanesulfonate monooxygenase SsuD/methylene tetrahydromethanopterin reductase-like flavin-dependent oxidoreductase (luciferase family)
MKFGIFDYIDDRGEPLHKTYDDRLALLRAAEAAGFYGYHLTEHHGSSLDLCRVGGRFYDRRQAG